MKDMLGMGRNGPRQSLSTAVARVYVTTRQSRHKEWAPLVTGVVCFVKDFDRRSYYITVSATFCYDISIMKTKCFSRPYAWTDNGKSGNRKSTMR